MQNEVINTYEYLTRGVDLYTFIKSMNVNKDKYTNVEKIANISIVRSSMNAAEHLQEKNSTEYRLYNLAEKDVSENRNRYLVHATDRDANNFMFCIVCVLFGKGVNIFRTGCKINGYSVAHKHLCSHENTKGHQKALEEYLQLIRVQDDHILNPESTDNNNMSSVKCLNNMPTAQCISSKSVTSTTNTINYVSAASLMSANTISKSAYTTTTTTSITSSISIPVISHTPVLTPKHNSNKNNRAVVEQVIRCILFLISFGLPIRTSPHERSKKSELNNDLIYMKSIDEGYLKVLFKWTASLMADRSCFNYLQELNQQFLKNPKARSLCFLSSTFVTKVMNIIRHYIATKIASEIREHSAGMYSIQTDTTTDRATLQQCSVIVRYVNNLLQVKEKILLFLPVENSKGNTIFKLLEENLTKIGLNMKKMIGSAMDGAKSMTSNICGLSGLLMKINPAHIFTWCACHRFNLVLEDSFKENQHIIQLISSISAFSGFIRFSPNRMNDWKNIIGDLADNFKDISKALRPAQANATRWWSKYRAVNHIVKTESHLLAFLISLSNLNQQKKQSKWTEQQKQQIENFQEIWLHDSGSSAINIGVIYCVDKILARMHKTLDSLQSSAQPYCNMFTSISSCQEYLQKLLNDENGQFTDLVKSSRCFTERAITRLNINSVQALLNDKTDGSKLIIFTEHERVIRSHVKNYLKSLILNIGDRFLADFRANEAFYKELSLFSPRNVVQIDEHSNISLDMLPTYNNMPKDTIKSELKKFGPVFKAFLNYSKRSNSVFGFPSLANVQNGEESNDENDEETEINLDNDDDEEKNMRINIDVEWTLLKEFFANDDNREQFKNVNILYQYILTLPGTQVECERSFSIMDNIKTSKRKIMSDSTLETYMMAKSSWEMLPENVIPQLVDLIANSNPHLKKKLIVEN